MKKTAGSVSGTRIVVLDGGPPEWDGEVTAVVASASGTLERWDHVADAAYVWEPTASEREVEVDRETRAGKVREKREALVYRALGYRDDIISQRPASEEGRQLRIEGVQETAPDPAEEDADS